MTFPALSLIIPKVSSYSYSSSSSSSGSGVVFIILVLIFLCVYLGAWIVAMLLITRAAREKGYVDEDDVSSQLWFIGLVVTPICPAVIVAALPDKKLQKSMEANVLGDKTIAVDAELPSL